MRWITPAAGWRPVKKPKRAHFLHSLYTICADFQISLMHLRRLVHRIGTDHSVPIGLKIFAKFFGGVHCAHSNHRLTGRRRGKTCRSFKVNVASLQGPLLGRRRPLRDSRRVDIPRESPRQTSRTCRQCGTDGREHDANPVVTLSVTCSTASCQVGTATATKVNARTTATTLGCSATEPQRCWRTSHSSSRPGRGKSEAGTRPDGRNQRHNLDRWTNLAVPLLMETKGPIRIHHPRSSSLVTMSALAPGTSSAKGESLADDRRPRRVGGRARDRIGLRARVTRAVLGQRYG